MFASVFLLLATNILLLNNSGVETNTTAPIISTQDPSYLIPSIWSDRQIRTWESQWTTCSQVPPLESILTDDFILEVWQSLDPDFVPSTPEAAYEFVKVRIMNAWTQVFNLRCTPPPPDPYNPETETLCEVLERELWYLLNDISILERKIQMNLNQINHLIERVQRLIRDKILGNDSEDMLGDIDGEIESLTFQINLLEQTTAFDNYRKIELEHSKSVKIQTLSNKSCPGY